MASSPSTQSWSPDKYTRRVAHATHALLAASRDLNMPVTAAEIVLYDDEAPSAVSTGVALAHAAREGLAVFTGRYWVPTNFASAHRTEFEDRFLRETARSGDG